MRSKTICMVLLLLLMMMTSWAMADTAQELYIQAQTPWQETLHAFGREIVLDVKIEMPDVQTLNIYRAQTVSAREMTGDYVSRKQLPKKRGLAVRRKPEEVIPVAQIDRAYRAYDNPLCAGEAMDTVQAFLDAMMEEAQGVSAVLETMTVESPRFVYNKNTGEWLGQAYTDETGGYHFECGYWLDGVRVERHAYPQWRDHRNVSFDIPTPDSAYWSSHLHVEDGGRLTLDASMPSIVRVTQESIALAPLEATKDALRTLVERGLLRSIKRMALVYAGFDYGEGEEWEIRPVWMIDAEIYYDETRSAYDYGEPWYECVLTDARTGEIIQFCWADGCEPQGNE